MTRISAKEAYSNRDLIAQIVRLKTYVESGTVTDITVTDNHDGTITIDLTMRDGTIQTFTLANDNIATIAAVQNGADVTVTVTFESGITQSFTFNVASGKVDVLTTIGDYVYSHSGATQGEIPVTDAGTPGTVMKRDGSGQTQVKSPASDIDSDYAVNMSKLNARLTDGSVTKVGTSNVGNDLKPIKLVNGVPTVVMNDFVDLPSAQAITGIKTVPLEATGTFSNQIASSNKVKNELDNYAPMLRTTGNQNFSGIKRASGSGFIRKKSGTLDLTTPPAGTITDETYVLEDKNGTTCVSNFNSYTENSQTIYQISTKYPFMEGGVAKITTGALWVTVYKDRMILFIRFTDKNGTSHLKSIGQVTESDP